jgi:hypothetical protein
MLSTFEKAQKFRREISQIDDLLMSSKTINLEELRSETQRSDRILEDRPLKMSEDVSFDIAKIKMNKLINVQQAHHDNLKSKKNDI